MFRSVRLVVQQQLRRSDRLGFLVCVSIGGRPFVKVSQHTRLSVLLAQSNDLINTVLVQSSRDNDEIVLNYHQRVRYTQMLFYSPPRQKDS